MASLSLPLIAAIQGYAYGAGLEMSLYCDLRVGSEDAMFAIPEVRLGYIPSAGGTQLIARYVPQGDAMRMATSGEPIDVREAYRLGLVHSVTTKEALLDTARLWANALAALKPAAVRATKRAVVEGIDLTLAEGLALERRLAATVA
jgi:enoyl-CoA hydratase/carnithine racemase